MKYAPLTKAEVEGWIQAALARLERNLPSFTSLFPAPSSKAGRYEPIGNVEWTNGFWSGMLWLAYELSGDQRYRVIAEHHVQSFHARLRERVNVDHHDLGFLYTLSCVSAWRLTGNAIARYTALEAAELLLARYLPNAQIIQAWGDLNDPAQRGRMIIDCNLNLPLLFWATQITGDPRYATAAHAHLRQAARYLVRPDSSTFHTFFMDGVDGRPLYGKTHQGYADDSCWARGQAWAMYGFPLCYRYDPDTGWLKLGKRVSDYFLDRLPNDAICAWDLVLTSDDAQRDSSAAAIAVCGLLELARSLPITDGRRATYERAAATMLRELSERYLAPLDNQHNGLLMHAVYHMPNGVGVDESCIWGDYFYLESLMRVSRPWTPYW